MDFAMPADTFISPGNFKIEGAMLVLTCSACPEQYDVFKGGQQIGYLRLRSGSFTADYPYCGGRLVYSAHPRGDGMFDDEYERRTYLTKAVSALKAAAKSEGRIK